MKNEGTKALREGAMMVALGAVLLLANRYIPFFSVVGMFVCGVPMAALAVRHSFKTVVPALIATLIVSILIDGNILSAVSMMLMSVIPGAATGFMLGRKKPFYYCLTAVTLTVSIGWIFELFMLEVLMDNGIEKILSETMGQVEPLIKGAVEKLDGLKDSQTFSPETLVNAVLDATRQTIKLYFPSFVVIFAMVTGYIIMRVSAFIINRARLSEVESVPFSKLKAPRSMSTVAIICYLVYVFWDKDSRLWPVFANVATILYSIISVTGLSVIDFKLKVKIPSGFLRFLIYALVFIFGSALMGVVSSVLIVIGILDASRNFRGIEEC